jgi:hypothetical protein
MTKEDVDDRSTNGTAVAPRARVASHFARACPPHSWDCPVVMKLDPRFIAWTCAKCGEITTVPVGPTRPQRPGP